MKLRNLIQLALGALCLMFIPSCSHYIELTAADARNSSKVSANKVLWVTSSNTSQRRVLSQPEPRELPQFQLNALTKSNTSLISDHANKLEMEIWISQYKGGRKIKSQRAQPISKAGNGSAKTLTLSGTVPPLKYGEKANVRAKGFFRRGSLSSPYITIDGPKWPAPVIKFSALAKEIFLGEQVTLKWSTIRVHRLKSLTVSGRHISPSSSKPNEATHRPTQRGTYTYIAEFVGYDNVTYRKSTQVLVKPKPQLPNPWFDRGFKGGSHQRVPLNEKISGVRLEGAPGLAQNVSVTVTPPGGRPYVLTKSRPKVNFPSPTSSSGDWTISVSGLNRSASAYLRFFRAP